MFPENDKINNITRIPMVLLLLLRVHGLFIFDGDVDDVDDGDGAKR